MGTKSRNGKRDRGVHPPIPQPDPQRGNSMATEILSDDSTSGKSYAAEVNTASDPEGVFTGNGLRFATREEAESYALDLALRWTAVADWRVVESTDEPNR